MTDVATPVRSRESLDSPRLWRPFATGGISLAGIGISIYLLIVHYEPQALVCSTSGIVNCEKVLTSPQSVILGIPVPMFGIAFFVAMSALSLPAAWRSTSPWLARARLAAVVVGMGMVVYLISQEALTLHAICLWCTSVHVLTFALFLIVITGWEDTGYAQSLYED
jgi:uncharacterized membrane protein